MLGAILGDIIGSRFEFSKLRLNKSEDFELFTDKCHFTDDTVLTIATADAIINNKGFAEAYYEWGNKYPNSGFGGMFRSWLSSSDKKPYNSFGNGSAMRVSPIGWISDNLYETINLSLKSCICTHNHYEGIKGAKAIAAAIWLARRSFFKSNVKNWIINNIGYNLDRTIEQIRPMYEFDVTCQGSVPEAIICFLESDSYESAVRKAVSLGGDTDTQACIAGSIAEAYYGIPDNIKKKVYDYLPEDMINICEKFNEMIERRL